MISHLLFTIHNDIYFKILRQNRIRNDREGLRRPASHAEGEEDSLAALGAEQSSCSHLRRRIATKGGAQGVVNKLRGTGWGAHVVTLWAPSSGRLTGARLSHLRCAYKCEEDCYCCGGTFLLLMMITKMRTGDKVEDRLGCSCRTKRPLGSF